MNLPPIVDAHHQFAPPDAGSEGFAPLLEQSGVERTVLVQPEKSLDATRAALELAEASAFVAGAVVWATSPRLDLEAFSTSCPATLDSEASACR